MMLPGHVVAAVIQQPASMSAGKQLPTFHSRCDYNQERQMAFIETIAVEQATDEVRSMYECAQADLGYVPNYARLFSHRPRVMEA